MLRDGSPDARQARQNGVKTLYGSPEPEVMRQGSKSREAAKLATTTPSSVRRDLSAASTSRIAP